LENDVDSKYKGGLTIRDHVLMNLAMGAKLVWWLVTDTQEWWKTILFKKYFSQTRKICLDVPLDKKNGSQYGICVELLHHLSNPN
jgi:hypothetical protein